MYAKVPPHQGGLPEAFNPPAGSVSVRDLDSEGVMANINVSQAWSSGGISTTMAVIDLQGQTRSLRDRLARLEEVVADLMRKKA